MQTLYEDGAAITESLRATGVMLQVTVEGVWREGEMGDYLLTLWHNSP